ncbi:hypothetical protein LTR04_005662 [Oleoguttula sp. CCFEE 6159]|nr:hypothetical protein LTR04_005662 [Oleoguttula sp. CCFEE 6159]
MDRYEPDARIEIVLAPRRGLTKEDVQSTVSKGESSGPAYKIVEGLLTDSPKRRTAVLIRTWEGHSYTQNDFQAIRALITELSLLSGGEYQVFLFVNVKDYNAPIFDNDQVYRDVLKSAVPQEFRDISVLWNEKLCTEWYPVIGDWQVYWHQFMPLQWFSKNHPEFDYVWNWEMDARYIGNHYHFLEQIAAFSRNVPRKHLWEQNQRFYFPEVHGIYQNYIDDTNAIIANVTSKGLLTPVWGPQSYSPKQEPLGPDPPRTSDQDNYTWGADEEADLITLQPIWDPTKTGWDFKYKIWNFAEGKSPHFSPDNPLDPSFYDPSFETLPRRVFINTQVRLSKKMLHAMHVENQAGRTMQAEMWPATVALHHGLKAVYAPHPIWLDRKWPAWYLDAVFNADGGKAARWGVDSDSVYNRDREVNFKGWSWYYTSYFPKVLYRRWLGWKAEDGLGNVGGEQWEKEYGRMCLPGMLLHPVKDVEEEQT